MLIGAILVAGVFAGARPVGPLATLLLVIGGALVAVGLAVAVAGVLQLGPSVSPFPRPRQSSELVESGTYRWIRHPIYSGLILAALGWSLATASLAALALSALLAIVLDLKSRREEQWCLAHFATYAAYSARTKRFIPGIY